MAHHVGHADVLRGLPAGVGGHADVSIGDDADDLQVRVDDGHRAAVAVPHDAGGGAGHVIGRTGVDGGRHDGGDVHGPCSVVTVQPASTGARTASVIRRAG